MIQIAHRQNLLFDLLDVKGQEHVKRAVEVAAAGGHNLIMIGPPGSGKTMIAKRIPSILPRLSMEESLETTKIQSIVGVLPSDTPLVGNASVSFSASYHFRCGLNRRREYPASG